MRFAIATIDRYLGVFEAFVFSGWKPLKLFTVPVKSELANNQAAIAYAEKNGAAIQISRLAAPDLARLRDDGCEALIVASYDWKICDWQPYLRYAVNFHASPLPHGRGPYPAIRAILEQRASWAVTCHRLAPEIDKGDILAAEEFPLAPDECHESFDLKIQMAAKKLAIRVTARFADLWDHAQPQGEGSYWKQPALPERIVDFNQPVAAILRHIRAFGSTESIANVGGAWLVVRRAIGWTELHNQPPGAVAHVFNRSIVVAAADGYIGILDSNLAPAALVAALHQQLENRPGA